MPAASKKSRSGKSNGVHHKSKEDESTPSLSSSSTSSDGSTKGDLLYAAVVQGIIIGLLVGAFLLYIRSMSPLGHNLVPDAAAAFECPSCPTCTQETCPDLSELPVCDDKKPQICKPCPVPEGYTHITTQQELMARHPDVESFSNPRVLPVASMFTKEECARIIAEGTKLTVEPHIRIQGDEDGTKTAQFRIQDARTLPKATFAWVYERIMAHVAATNAQHWRFRIPTNYHSPLLEDVKLIEYDAEKKAHHNWHSDVAPAGPEAKRLLSVTVQLSDASSEYEGGDMLMQVTSHAFPLTKDVGAGLFYPSYVLNKVTEVTKGKRYTLQTYFQTY